MDRSKKIIRTSVVGIAVNLVLVTFKMIVGLAVNSIAIILDAVNNLSDALSSLITIVGTKLAGRAPDKKHPFGYGRIEYLTSVLIAVIVLTAGATSFKESAVKVFHPEEANYSVVSLVIIAVAVVVKFLCGTYVKKIGEEVDSGSLIASGSDAFFDSVLSAATLAAAIISMKWGLSLEGILGVVISILILKAGLEMLMETLDHIIGARADRELTLELKRKIASYPGAIGAFDLALHNYGPNEYIGSVHVEVPDHMTAPEMHMLSRHIMEDIQAEYGIVLTVGFYASNNTDPLCVRMRHGLSEILKDYPGVLQMHGFYVDEVRQEILFDLVIDFKMDTDGIVRGVKTKMEEMYPEYRTDISVDISYTD